MDRKEMMYDKLLFILYPVAISGDGNFIPALARRRAAKPENFKHFYFGNKLKQKRIN